MFIVAQLPLADLRPMVRGEKGRLDKPDWKLIDLSEGFIKGFGKVATRNKEGLGLPGEESFVDFNNALRFIEPIYLRHETWPRRLLLTPWFRRLYYDGQVAGRFEVGFLASDRDEEAIFEASDAAVFDPSLIVQALLATTVEVRAVDGSREQVAFGRCARLLGFAYLAATTRNDALNEFPIGETYDDEVAVGPPLLHIRVSSDRPIEAGRDVRRLSGQGEKAVLITSAREGSARNTVVIQASPHGSLDEAADERVTRVIFAHLNAVLFAHAHFVRRGDTFKSANSREFLRKAIDRMTDRFGRFVPGSAADDALGEGLALFAKAYAARVEDMTARLEELSEEWDKPTMGERGLSMVTSLVELIITTAVKTATEKVVKGQ